MKQSILILDFGSQVTKLIARRIREFGVFSQIIPFDSLSKSFFSKNNVKGIIFSGGPRSVENKNSPKPKVAYSIPIRGFLLPVSRYVTHFLECIK